MRNRLPLLVAAGSLALAPCAAFAQAAAPAAGTARGELIVDGRRLAVKHAIAVSLPDTFDETKEAFAVLLTPEPVAAATLAALTDPDDWRGQARTGLAVKFGNSGSMHMTIRHAALKGELQTSNSLGPRLDVKGPDRVAGTLASFPEGKVEDISGHKVQFTIAFNAPVKHRFALEQPLVLAASARKLPAGGGDAGKAWVAAKCPAIPANLKDPKVLEKWLGDQGMLPTQKDLDEMSKQKGKKVTLKDAIEEAAAMVDMISAMAPRDCKVLGGSSDGTLARLQVEATVFGSRSRADVFMAQSGGKWTVKKQEAWKDATSSP
jgi:hypothetical protein